MCLCMYIYIYIYIHRIYMYIYIYIYRKYCNIGPTCCAVKKEVRRKRNTQTRR